MEGLVTKSRHKPEVQSKLNGDAAQLLSVESYRSKNSTKVSPVVTSSYLHRPTSKGSQYEGKGDTQ